MGRVATNSTGWSFSVEATPGVLAGSPTWKLMEPNDIGKFGAQITTVPRQPISKNRQRRKGVVTDLDSSAEFTCDATRDALLDFIEGFTFATMAGLAGRSSVTDSLVANDDVAGAGLNGFEHSALPAAYAANTLIFSRGFSKSVNNGLWVIDGPNSTTTVSAVTATGTIVDETPTAAQNASIAVAGRRGAVADITWVNASKTLGSTVLDFTTLGWTVGQYIFLGGTTATNQFVGGTLLGRIKTLAAHSTVLDNTTGTLVADDAGTGKAIDILFGRFSRNVPVDNGSYLERTYQFEATFPNLVNPGPGDKYSYSKGNYASQMELTLALNTKATVKFSFVGLDTVSPSITRASGASAPINPVQTVAYGTTTDLARIRLAKVDDTGLTTCFKSLTLTLNNNTAAEKCLGVLGASFIDTGLFDVDIKSEVLFTESAVVDAIHDNVTVELDFLLKNSDGGVMFDIPALTLGDGSYKFPLNQAVTISLSGQAFADPTLNISLGVSFFPVLP